MKKPNKLGRHLLTVILVINVMEIVFESGNIRLQNSNSRLRNVKQQKLCISPYPIAIGTVLLT
jgi:hypothetical protein